MTDPQYSDINLVELYDQLNPLARDSAYFLTACAPSSRSVLDLGCGTGLLTSALAAQGHDVVGVDPAAQMLAVARQRDPQTTWLCADARTLALPRQFDRVIASGHVFQVFLTEADQLTFLDCAARHLSSDGRLIFDTRNPAAQAWLDWTPEKSRRRIIHPTHGTIDIWHEVIAHENVSQTGSGQSGDGLRFRSTYQFQETGRAITSDSALAFPTMAVLEQRLHQSGFEILTLHGDWDGTTFHPGAAEIIITAKYPRRQNIVTVPASHAKL